MMARVNLAHHMLAVALVASVAGAQQANTLDELGAEAQSAQGRGDMPAAIAAYRKLIKLYPRTAPAYNNLGSLLYDTGDYRGAIEVTEAGLRLDRAMASSYAVLGAAYLAVGDDPKAVAALKTAVARNPKDERSQAELVQALVEEKNYLEAAALLRAQTERNPRDQGAWRQLGDVYLVMSQEAHGKVLAIDPASATALDLAGEIQEGIGHYQAAEAKYAEALEKAPDQPGTHEHLGNIFWVQGEWKKAETEFAAELAANPTDCRAAWKLGDSLLQEREDTSGAFKALDRAVERCPTLMQARVDRGQALIELGRGPEALPDLLLAERDTPDEPQIHFLLARVYRAQGKGDEARAETELFARLTEKRKAAAPAPQP